MVREMLIETQSAQDTFRLGEALGKLLEAGDFVLLSGDLGAGKTTFSKGVAVGLGVTDEVTSPTFTLVAEYDGRVPLAHMDLYRLVQDAEDEVDVQTEEPGGATPASHGAVLNELARLGFDDYLEGDYAVLVEWGEALADRSSDGLEIRIERQPMPHVDRRLFRCTATGERSWVLLDEWVKQWLF